MRFQLPAGEDRRAVLAHALALGGVVLAALFLFGSLVDRRGFRCHEGPFPYMRTEQYAAELARGHVPQAFPDAAFGDGVAFPRFYPPLPYLVALVLSLPFGDYMLGVNLAFLLSIICAALAMYYMAWRVTGDRWLAAAAALVYTVVPYRFVDVFVRGALAESWAFVWFPLVVAGAWESARRRSEAWFVWYFPLVVAGMLLTHNVTLLYFLPVCLAIWLMRWRMAGRSAALGLAIGGALGVGLTLWFLLPQQYYVPTVAVSDRALMGATVEEVSEHRVFPSQLFASSPEAWRGGSTANDDRDTMSFSLGLGSCVALLSAAWLVYGLARRSAIDRERLALGLILAAAWIASVAFMLVPEVFLSVLPASFLYVQFPWRLLGQSAFFAAAALATLAAAVSPPRWLCATLAGAAVLVVLAVPAYQKQGDWQDDWTTASLTTDALRRLGKFGFTVQAEYMPREIDVKTNAGKETYTVPQISGDASVVDWHKNGLDVDVDLTPGARVSGLLVPLLYYDFYEARARDGTPLSTSSYKGFLVTDVPPGVDRVSIRQRITPVARMGFAASCLTALAWAWIAYRRHISVSRVNVQLPENT